VVDSSAAEAVYAVLLDRLASCNKYLYMKGHLVEKCFFIFANMLALLKGDTFDSQLT
jgi:hypothetical protein